jgi:hypothetical protein
MGTTLIIVNHFLPLTCVDGFDVDVDVEVEGDEWVFRYWRVWGR